MEIQVIKDITIGGKSIDYIIGFELSQSFNAHHYFELRFNHDVLGAPGLISLDDSRDLVGKGLTATFGIVGGKQQKFAGIVTKISLTQSHGYHGVIVASGYSPTILIERGPDLGSYYNKTLDAIVRLATRDTAANELSIVSNPERKKVIDYMMQYQESDFAFLNRLSGEYFEWFFYDGEKLHFGKPASQGEVTLTYGRDVQSLQYGIEVAPVINKRFAYNAEKDEVIQSKSTGKASGRPDLVHAGNRSGNTFSKVYNQSSLIRVETNGDIKDVVDNEEKANTGQLLKVTGRGDNPAVSIGKVVDVSMSVRQGAGFETKSLGKFLITSIVHTIDSEGRYSNVFEGVVSTVEKLPYMGARRPDPEMLLAEVYDNADPLNQGRVRVLFKWQCETNDPTEWLRVITPDAGSSSKVSKNRGFVFIPEKGDQVVVGFEDGNIARPIVMGSVFHGKNSLGGSKNNDQKSLTTKSGHSLSMDDNGGILIKDKTDLNFIAIDGKDTITVSTDKNIILQTGKVMIVLDKDKNKITLKAKDIEILGDSNITISGRKTVIEGSPVKINS